MKRIEQAVSSARAAKRSSASGSRSIATSVPDAPSRSATSRAWPPSPNVQSMAVCPGLGSSSSTSSRARTGVWEVGAADPPWAQDAAGAWAERPSAGGYAASPEARRRRESSGVRWPDLRLGTMSLSVVDTGGHLRYAGEQRRSMVAPRALVPQLEAVAHADDDDVLGQMGFLAEA